MTELRSDWPQIVNDINGKRLTELADYFASPTSFKGAEDVEVIQVAIASKISELLKAESDRLSAGFNGVRDTLEIGKVLCSSANTYAFEGAVTGRGKSGFALTPQKIGGKLSLSENPNDKGLLIERMELETLS